MKMVEVEWIDPHSLYGEWTKVEEVDPADWEPKRCCNVGYLFRELPDAIVLVASDGGEDIGDGMVIPRGVITAVHELARVADKRRDGG